MRRINNIFVACALLGSALIVTGCGTGDSGPDNQTVVNELKSKGQINTNPNQPNAVQPRDLRGNPITVGGQKGGAKLGTSGSSAPAGQ